MTKKEILDYFKDINYMYNNSNVHDTLSTMIDELLETQKQELMKTPRRQEFMFDVKRASSLILKPEDKETVYLSTIHDLYMLAIKYGGQGGEWSEKEISDLVIKFTDNEGHADQRIIIYDDYLE